METYSHDPASVNGEVGEIELPAFLPRQPAQAPTCKPRRCLSPETWGRINAAVARERQLLALLAPASPRIKPTLSVLRWLGQLGEAA